MSDKLFNLAIDGVSYNIMAAGTLFIMADKPKPHAYEAIGLVAVGCIIVAGIGMYLEARRLVMTSQDQSKEPDSATIDDGTGGLWWPCGPKCSLHVVRPGKVQCNRDCAECPSREETR